MVLFWQSWGASAAVQLQGWRWGRWHQAAHSVTFLPLNRGSQLCLTDCLTWQEFPNFDIDMNMNIFRDTSIGFKVSALFNIVTMQIAESMWKLTNSKSLYILHLVDLSTGSLFNVYTPANISIITILVNMPAECTVGRDPDFILLHTTLLLLPVLTFKLKMEQMWETCSGDTHAASGIPCRVELQTKVPEDYAKFYNHREGPY